MGGRKGKRARCKFWLPQVRVRLGCGVKGLSAVTVVSVALATGGEIHYAQCRCSRVEWAYFLQIALDGPETVTSAGLLPRWLAETFGVWRSKCGNSEFRRL